MRKIKIITDSTAGLTLEEAAKWNIDVLYLTVEIDGQIYNPKTDITPEEFMVRMAETKELPKSSQPAIGSFVEAYEKYTAEGYEILSIHLTEKLSGTVNAARQAKRYGGRKYYCSRLRLYSTWASIPSIKSK